jgi:hypothetical protein
LFSWHHQKIIKIGAGWAWRRAKAREKNCYDDNGSKNVGERGAKEKNNLISDTVD